MQTVELFDGVRDHILTIVTMAPDPAGFAVVVRDESSDTPRRYVVSEDEHGSFSLSLDDGRRFRAVMGDDRYAQEIAVTASSQRADDPAASQDVSLRLAGTIADSNDVSGHGLGGTTADLAALAAASGCVLINQMTGSSVRDSSRAPRHKHDDS